MRVRSQQALKEDPLPVCHDWAVVSGRRRDRDGCLSLLRRQAVIGQSQRVLSLICLCHDDGDHRSAKDWRSDIGNNLEVTDPEAVSAMEGTLPNRDEVESFLSLAALSS